MFAFVCVAAALIVAGLAMLLFGAFMGFMGGLPQALLCGLGFFSGGLSLGALQILIGIGLTNLMMRYGRFHVRLLKPATA
jgi:hypothetical protein